MSRDITPRLATRREQLTAIVDAIGPDEEVTSYSLAPRLGRTRVALLEDLFRLEAAGRLASRVPEVDHPGSPVRLWRRA